MSQEDEQNAYHLPDSIGSIELSWEEVGIKKGGQTYSAELLDGKYKISVRYMLDKESGTPTGDIKIWMSKEGKFVFGSKSAIKMEGNYSARMSSILRNLEGMASIDNHPTAIATEHEASEMKCPVCGSKMAVRHRRSDGEPFYGCTKYPACKGTRNVGDSNTQEQIPVPVADNAPPCPKCGAEMRLRNGKYGMFYGCVKYPECRGTVNYVTSMDAPAKSETVIEKTAPVVLKLDYSPYQLAIFDDMQNGSGNTMIEGVAGCGKTYTIVRGMDYLPQELLVAYLAFGKDIAAELKEKAPPSAYVSTTHSLCNSNIKAAWKNASFDGKKDLVLLDTIMQKRAMSMSYEVLKQHSGAILKFVSLCKNVLIEPTDTNLKYLSDMYNIDTAVGCEEIVYSAARELYTISIESIQYTFNFDDMLYASAVGMVPCQQFDIILADEVQDWNAAQIEVGKRSIKSGGRFISVGDRFQSIFGFRGADMNAIPNIISAFESKILPLSVCYRCPTSHVNLAKELVPHIEAWDQAIEGVIDNVSEGQFLLDVVTGDMVLCRMNAPLISYALHLIREGKKAVVLGRDIAGNLVYMLNKTRERSGVFTLNDTLVALRAYVDSESMKLKAVGKEMRAQNLEDKCETLIALSDGCSSIPQVVKRINTVFSDTVEGVTFSSVHKAKGKQTGKGRSVYILEPQLMPFPKATSEQELQQEYNVKYVAQTRSQLGLYFVEPRRRVK